MTIRIGKSFAIGVLVVLLVAGAAGAGYKVGSDRQDVARAVRTTQGRAKAAEARAFERGRAQGDSEGRGALVKKFNSQESVDSDVIKYLGYDRTDWKKNGWYLVGVTTRGGGSDPKYVSVFDRKLMSPGLEYSVCGDDHSSLCWREE
jgi:hypothetical protein